MSAPTWRQALAMGLVESGNHQVLYQTNASFRATVTLLVDMLPLWVDGIAVRSVGDEERRQKLIHDLTYNVHPQRIVITPEMAREMGLDK